MAAGTSQVNTLKGRSSRRFPRFTPRVSLSAIFRSDHNWVEGEVGSVSECGFLLVLQSGGSAEELGAVTIQFPNFYIHTKGIFQSVIPGQGVSIEFLDMNLKDRKLLASYCAYLQRLTKARPA